MSHRHPRSATAAAASLLFTLALQPAAHAADATDDQQSLGRVTITAQKREQASVDVPASVSTISADKLERSGMTRLEDYAATIPGMSITALTRGYTSVVLRGISTGISQATPSTAYYIDEAPIGSITAYATGSTLTPDLDPYDLRRVEVLKGPQGTLYGAGAVGGLLRYVTAPANGGSFGGAVSLGANTVADGGNGHEARAALNIPLREGMGLRVSAFQREDAGYIDNPAKGKEDVNDARTRGGRIAFQWDISADWSLQAWAMTQRFKAGGVGAQDLSAPTLTPVTRDLERRTFIDERQAIGLDVYNATVKGRAAGFELVSSTTYQKVAAETHVDQSALFGALLSLPRPLGLGVPNIGAETSQGIDTKRWSQEVRARSSALGEKLEYEAGLFWTKEDSKNFLPPQDPFITTTGAPFPVGLPLANAHIDIHYKETSAFANATYAITPRIDIMGGVRYGHNNQDFVQDYQAALLTPVPVLVTQAVSNNKTTWLLSGRYKPAEDTAIYVRAATGYRPGGPSALPSGVVAGGKTSFEPDTLTSYELGFKSALGSRASLEAAVFSTDWKNIQIQTSARTAAGNFNYFVNGGTARSSGAEATLLLFPVQGLTLRGTAAYTDSRLTSDAPAAGGIDGDRMPFVPRVTASLSADYRFGLGAVPAWLGATVQHVGERRSNFTNKTPFDVPGYTTLGMNAGVDVKNIRVTLYGKNVTNERGINFLNGTGLPLPGLNPLGNPYAAGVIQPRTFGVDVAYRF
jgi:iron complex outermembrane receptor protein